MNVPGLHQLEAKIVAALARSGDFAAYLHDRSEVHRIHSALHRNEISVEDFLDSVERIIMHDDELLSTEKSHAITHFRRKRKSNEDRNHLA